MNDYGCLPKTTLSRNPLIKVTHDTVLQQIPCVDEVTFLLFLFNFSIQSSPSDYPLSFDQKPLQLHPRRKLGQLPA
ncbi:hypothetical protein GCM10008106_32590 [Mongoliitalea lutea]|uniref:Uncharacterized protein n=1 Tax=Mongoliitalea lutea TaxID=849756 RepID=A0A8J3CZT1_9BACT|nr:hypothetical protein GCM10008106_32590 [Mongoliitalea lutea]